MALEFSFWEILPWGSLDVSEEGIIHSTFLITEQLSLPIFCPGKLETQRIFYILNKISIFLV
jgi:hypothetical protein